MSTKNDKKEVTGDFKEGNILNVNLLDIHEKITQRFHAESIANFRIHHYLGEIAGANKGFITNQQYLNVDCELDPDDLFIDGLYGNLILKMSDKGLNAITSPNMTMYIKPLIKLLTHTQCMGKFFLYLIGDVIKYVNDYYFTKVRPIGCNKCIILKCPNITRHWGLVFNKSSYTDIEYHKKKDVAVWRGATTGDKSSPANRFTLVSTYGNSFYKEIDIGFSKIVSSMLDVSGGCLNEFDDYIHFQKQSMSLSEQLQYKFIIAVEGNDKSTGINWQLNSNSLVMMAKPRKISWLMEDKLIPNVHYILLEDDFSNLIEKVRWCIENEIACMQIVRNANLYMHQFSNPETELFIESKVMKTYFENIFFTT